MARSNGSSIAPRTRARPAIKAKGAVREKEESPGGKSMATFTSAASRAPHDKKRYTPQKSMYQGILMVLFLVFLVLVVFSLIFYREKSLLYDR
jgi:cobalamin biosynthesis Mg chelatase CobN